MILEVIGLALMNRQMQEESEVPTRTIKACQCMEVYMLPGLWIPST
jgi:hypothetical protein